MADNRRGRSACVSGNGSAAQPRRGGKARGPPFLPLPLSASLQNGCISDAAASSLERLTRVCEPQLFMRGECSRGPRCIYIYIYIYSTRRLSESDEYAYLNSRG